MVCFMAPCRKCEYDDSVHEFWVNTRTTGTMSREDMLELAHSQSHEGALQPDQLNLGTFDFTPGGFSDLGAGEPTLEGDTSMTAPHLLTRACPCY